MDSKATYTEEVAPPSYSESISHPTTTPLPSHYSAVIRTQLLALAPQIREQQTRSPGRDHHTLSLLTHEIQQFLAAFAESRARAGTLILVPARALRDGATPLGDDLRDPADFDRVVRVAAKEDGAVWDWGDEALVGRLARGLGVPGMGARKVVAPRREREQVPQVSGGGGFFGRRSSARSGYNTAVTASGAVADPRAIVAAEGAEDKVSMDVVAEEVVFRSENDLGVYETQRGWAVVLKLKVDLGRR